MPQRKSAKRELKKSLKRKKRNLRVKSQIKKIIKRFKQSLKENNTNLISENLRLAYKTLDKASSKKVIHPNKAARKKSKLAKLAMKLIQHNKSSNQQP